MTEQDKDFFKDMASKLYGISYEEVTEEQGAEVKKSLFDFIYGRSDDNPFKQEVD